LRLGLNPNGLPMICTPYETVLNVVKQLWADKYFVQVAWNGEFYRTPGVLETANALFQEKGVRILHGALIHGPEAVARGSLEEAITGKVTWFHICAALNMKAEKNFEERVSEWRKLPCASARLKERDLLVSESQLVNRGEQWDLYHREEAALLNFADTLLVEGVRKVFRKNGCQVPTDYPFPKYSELWGDTLASAYGLREIQMYFDDGCFVLFRRIGKDHRVDVQELPLEMKEFVRPRWFWCFIPHLVGRRVYSKKTLRRCALNFFIISLYLLGIMFGGLFAFQRVLEQNWIIMGFCAFIVPMMSVMSVVLSVHYLWLGIFGQSRFVLVDV